MKITFLGTGTSVGIPAIGCDCAVCRSADPRDSRLRCSLWVRTPRASWIVDTGPDLRQQSLRSGINRVDAVLITHAHTDHIMGFDDLRRFCHANGGTLPVHATPATLGALESSFGFAFDPARKSPGYLHVDARPINGPFTLGETRVTAVPVRHGGVDTVGYRFDTPGWLPVFYASDMKEIPRSSRPLLDGVGLLIIDALRHRDNQTHMTVAEAIALSESLGRPRTFLTHISCEVSHAELARDLPAHVSPAHDLLEISVPPCAYPVS